MSYGAMVLDKQNWRVSNVKKLKWMLLLLLAMIQTSCMWRTTHKIEQTDAKAEVCRAWVLVSYDKGLPGEVEDKSNFLDTKQTVSEIETLNARRREYCGD